MSTTIISALVGLFCTSVSSIVTFLLTRRKFNSEVDSQQLHNVNESFELYKKMTNEAINLQNGKIDLLQKENDNLRKQIQQLQSQILNLTNALYNTPAKTAYLDNYSAPVKSE